MVGCVGHCSRSRSALRDGACASSARLPDSRRFSDWSALGIRIADLHSGPQHDIPNREICRDAGRNPPCLRSTRKTVVLANPQLHLADRVERMEARLNPAQAAGFRLAEATVLLS